MQERFRQLAEGRRNMTILQEGDIVTMIYSSGDTMRVVPDGKRRTQKTVTGEVDFEIEARWVDLALEVNIQRSEGAEMTRLYRISDEGRLEVVNVIQPPRGGEPIEIVTVYDEVIKE
jgi:hypothetical protein